MEAKKGLLRIGIPTGFGTNGVRKEAVKIAKVMLTQMGAGNIEQYWGKYYIPKGQNESGIWDYRHTKWGMVLSVEVPDAEYALSIMKSFEYDEIVITELEKRRDVKNYYEVVNHHSPSYTKKHVIGDDY